MKILPFLLGALVFSAAFASKAYSHPNHHGGTVIPVAAPVQLMKLEPEQVLEFDYKGGYYTVTNKHVRGLFGVELIEIHDSRGMAVAGWWTTRGWCFTQHAVASNACFSAMGFQQFIHGKMTSASYTRSPSLYTGGKGAAADWELCDHYSKLEYVISEDDSGVCDY
jgi:hypothetical protein